MILEDYANAENEQKKGGIKILWRNEKRMKMENENIIENSFNKHRLLSLKH